MTGRRPLIAYWTGEEPTGPNYSPTLADIPSWLMDSIDFLIINYVTVGGDGSLDFSHLTQHNNQETIMKWIAKIRVRQKSLPNKTKFLMSLDGSDSLAKLDPMAFAGTVKAAATNWGMDGVDVDYEPRELDPKILGVVKAIKDAFAPSFLLTTPIYRPWVDGENARLLSRYAAPFNYVTTMDYTPYPGFDETISLVKRYAEAIGGEDPYEKLLIGVSCMDFNDDRHTPLQDVPALCSFRAENGSRPGMMLFNLSYDTPNHTAGKYPFALFTYANMLAADVHPA
jgi:Glycosyl hydrolases family 18